MEHKIKTRTETILTIMKVLTWIAFIGFLIETGALLFSFIVSNVAPGKLGNLYKISDLSSILEYDFIHYSWAVSFLVAASAMKAFLCFLIIKTMSEVNLQNPFKTEVVETLERMSHLLIGIWIIAVLNNAHNEWLMKRTASIVLNGGSGEYLFIAGLVFIIAQIFKRGVEIQTENELTV
jgi:hypothetical protein